MMSRLFLLIFLFGLLKADQKNNISRDNVGVWLDSPFNADALRNKHNFDEIIKCIGSTFGTILWRYLTRIPLEGSGSDMLNDSLLMFPITAASYNKFVSALNNTTFSNNTIKNTTTGGSDKNKTVNVIMSFEILSVKVQDDPVFQQYMELSNLTDGNMIVDTMNTKSVDGAKLLADYANKLYNGTVDTLLIIDQNYLEGDYKCGAYDSETLLEETLHNVKWARNTLTNQLGAREYNLGVLLIHNFFLDDRPNLETSDIKIETLMNVDVIFLSTVDNNPNNNHLVEHVIIVEIIEESDRKLRNLKLNATIIPVISCHRRFSYFQYDYVDDQIFKCWQHMNDWAVRNNRKIIMFEAFDDPSNPIEFQGLGWWTIHSSKKGSTKLTQANFLSKWI